MKANLVFTDEAERLIEDQSKIVMQDLRNACIEEALKVRGEPVEVTASDVKRTISNVYIRRRSLKPSVDFILRLYMVVGIVSLAFGILVPLFTELLSNFGVSQIYFLMAALGLALILVSYLMRFYFTSIIVRHNRTTEVEIPVTRKEKNNENRST